MGEKVGDPGRVIGVALAPRYVTNMRGVGQDQFEIMAQHMPGRFPIDARRLHRYMRDLGLGEPRRQLHKASRRGREPSELRSGLPARCDPPAGHDFLLMHVQSRASPMQRLHRAPPMKGARRNGPEKLYSLLRAPGVAAEAVPPWRQSKVRLGRPIKLSAGAKHQEKTTTAEPVARTIPVSCIKVRDAHENSVEINSPAARRR